MKKILAIFIIVIASFRVANAQEYLGFQIGYAQSITRLNAPTVGQETTLNPTLYNGLKLGIVYDATIIKGFGVTMGLNYTFGANVTNWTQKYTSIYPKIRSRGQYHQLEIPVDWQYKFEIAKRTWIIVYTGPTLQCGLSFNDKWYIKENEKESSFTHDENFYSKDDMNDYTLKRINVTWGIGAGFQYERYFLRGGYDFGIINPYKEQMFRQYDVYTRGRFDQWHIKIGMYFWER